MQNHFYSQEISYLLRNTLLEISLCDIVMRYRSTILCKFTITNVRSAAYAIHS